MEQDKTIIDIQKYVRPLLRRKWLWIIPTIVISIGAIIYGLNRPDIYESKCVLIVEQPELINSVLLEGRGARQSTQKMLQAVGERIKGWEPVVKVIREIGLDKTISEDDQSGLEKLYDFIIEYTTLKILGGNRNMIEVSHRGTNPELNFKIVDGLVSNFMKQSIKSAQLEASETMAFIDEDIKRLKRDFDESEGKLREFEEENPADELPGGANNTLSKLSAAENELAEIDREIMILKETSRFLEDRKYMVTDEGVKMFTPLESSLIQQIVNFEIQIEMLHAKYSDEHPAIVIRKNELAQLKKALERESDKVVTEEGNSSVLTEREFDMQFQLKSLQTRREVTESSIAMLRDSFKDMPDYNQEFYELQRDYNLNKQLYEQRVLQRSRAELVRNISLDTKANPFTIIEPARIPKAPFKANKINTMVMGLILGASLGIGLVFSLERIDGRFKSVKEVPEYLQVPALGMIPTIITKTDERKRIKKRIILFSILAVCVAAVITVCFVVQPVKDVINDQATKVIKLIR